MQRRELFQAAVGAITVEVLTGGARAALAAEAARSVPKQLLRHALPDAPGKEGTVVLVTYAPGAESMPHRHPGSVFGYVLEGELTMHMEGMAPATYGKGDVFYEAPNQAHLVSRNASDKEPARLLAFCVTDKGQAVTLPLKAEG